VFGLATTYYAKSLTCSSDNDSIENCMVERSECLPGVGSVVSPFTALTVARVKAFAHTPLFAVFITHYGPFASSSQLHLHHHSIT
jgi:hypothetical protein